MTEAERLADALRGLFSDPQHGWFTPVSVSIQGLDPKQAALAPADRFNSVWEVVNHVRFWQDLVRLRLQGEQVDRVALGAENGWPPIGDPSSGEEWNTSCRRVLDANQALAEFVSRLSDEQLGQPYAEGRALRSQLIYGVIGHNCYHACEIISIRHMLGLWLDRT